MKLVLLLLAIYSLIFYQSYKIEKQKGKVVIKDNPNAGRFHKITEPGTSEFQNALLITTGDNTDMRPLRKKQQILKPLVFY